MCKKKRVPGHRTELQGDRLHFPRRAPWRVIHDVRPLGIRECQSMCRFGDEKQQEKHCYRQASSKISVVRRLIHDYVIQVNAETRMRMKR